jgi:hypothetical protein
METPVPSRREMNKPAKKMAKTVLGMMSQWTEDNFQIYVETMEMIRKGAPVQWAKLYHEAIKMGLDRNTNINININRQKDIEELQALVRTRINLPPTYTPYEEIKPKKEKILLKASE